MGLANRILLVVLFCIALVHNSRAAEFDIRDPHGTVIIAADKIKCYDWSKQMLTLVPGLRSDLFNELSKTGGFVSGRRFAVCIHGKPIYEGNFTTCASSLRFNTPVIVVNPASNKDGLKANEFAIQLGYPNHEFFKGDDPRGDKRIEEGLRADGKLIPPLEDHAAWVAKVLREIQTVKPGMLREDLLKICTEEGGLSTCSQRRYVHCACPLIKVDVKFDCGDSETNSLQEHPKDQITQISTPFLEWPISD
jgi:hypothetical protein